MKNTVEPNPSNNKHVRRIKRIFRTIALIIVSPFLWIASAITATKYRYQNWKQRRQQRKESAPTPSPAPAASAIPDVAEESRSATPYNTTGAIRAALITNEELTPTTPKEQNPQLADHQENAGNERDHTRPSQKSNASVNVTACREGFFGAAQPAQEGYVGQSLHELLNANQQLSRVLNDLNHAQMGSI